MPIVPSDAGDIESVVLDLSHTQAVLGWEAKVGFMLDWYDAHGVSAVTVT